jgi:hypothetical protein
MRWAWRPTLFSWDWRRITSTSPTTSTTSSTAPTTTRVTNTHRDNATPWSELSRRIGTSSNTDFDEEEDGGGDVEEEGGTDVDCKAILTKSFEMGSAVEVEDGTNGAIVTDTGTSLKLLPRSGTTADGAIGNPVNS